MKILFAGTPAFAAVHLQALLDNPQHQVVAVYTQPDRPAGRGKKLQPGPVKQLALTHGLPVYQPASLRDPAAQTELAALGADIMVVVAYGLILPTAVLAAPRYGCINVHASLLPRWRGAAPIQRAIQAGDSETGITIMQMDQGLDTGAMLHKVHCAIDPDETAASLHDKLAALGGPALLATLHAIATGTAVAEIQNDSDSCYADKISKAEAQIDWTLPATVIDRHIRAFNPVPVATTTLQQQPVKCWQADMVAGDSKHPAGTLVAADKQGIVVQCGRDCLRLTLLQLPGKRPLSAAELLNGHAALFAVGNRFSAATPA